MKLRNRILSAVMAIAACMTFVSTSAFATDGYNWTWKSSTEGKITAGTEFTVTLDITENAGLINLNAEVAYDAEGLEMTVKPTITTILGTNASLAAVANPYTISVGDGLDPVTETGTLATFSFKALKDGNWDITLTPDTENTIDGDFESIDFGSKVVTIEVGADTVPATATFGEEKQEGTVYGLKGSIAANGQTVTGVAFKVNNGEKDGNVNATFKQAISAGSNVTFGVNIKGIPSGITLGYVADSLAPVAE